MTDPVHGDIYLTELETRVLDSPPLQRLRRVRQLGMTHLIYPAATHNRFSHVVGCLRIAQDFMDTVRDQRSTRNPVPDLFEQWYREEPQNYERYVAEATVLARLGALLHDLGHVPFGHSVEDDLGILDPHDENELRFEILWAGFDENLRAALSGELLENLRPLILSSVPSAENGPPKYPFVADIVGNTICADLLDYLRRDHLYTGLPMALGRRFEAGFYVTPEGDPLTAKRMALSIVRGGQERVDAITEILKHLRYRYELSERALVHHAKLAGDAMIGKALEIWRDALWSEVLGRRLRSANKPDAGADDAEAQEQLAESELGPDTVAEIHEEVRGRMETELLRRGDDGLLEFLRDAQGHVPPRQGEKLDLKRRGAVTTLADDLLNRRLFKRIASQSDVPQERMDFYRSFGHPSTRRGLEQQAARFAGVDPAWRILIWLPSPDMRLKVAEVLIDDGEIRTFVEREKRGRRRGVDIYDAHEDLWAVSVFVHPEVKKTEGKRDQVLASLASQLNVKLGGLEARLGGHPWQWPDRLAVEQVNRERGGELDVEDLVEMRARGLRAARAEQANPTFKALLREYRELAAP